MLGLNGAANVKDAAVKAYIVESFMLAAEKVSWLVETAKARDECVKLRLKAA